MSITPETIYWITRLDSFRELLAILITISLVIVLICLVILAFCYLDCDTPDYEKIKIIKKPFYISIIIFILTIVSCSFIPSTKEAGVIIIIPAIVNSKLIQKIPIIFEKLADEWVKELFLKKYNSNE